MNTITAKAQSATLSPRLNTRPIPRPALRTVKPKLTVVKPKRGFFRYELSRETVKAAGVALIGMITLIMLQLVLSTLTASGVYEISKLKQEAAQLNITADILQAELYSLSSPQNLTNEAHKLGMTHAENPAYLSLATGEVLGKPKPAKGSVMVANLVPNASSD
jgi:hypothetical protein